MGKWSDFEEERIIENMLERIPFPEGWLQRRALFLGYILVIAVISLLPSESRSLPVKHIDKVGHFLAYVIMAILALVSFEGRKGRGMAVLLTFVVAFLLEWGQGFVPGRLSNLADGITNVLGLFAGLLIYWTYYLRS